MKKKITGSLLVFLLVLCLTGCGKSQSSEETEYDQAQMEYYAEFMINNFQVMTEEDLQSFKDMSDMELDLLVLQNNLPIEGEDFIAMMESWFAGVDECGEFQEYGSFEMQETNEGAVLTADATYADRSAELQFTFDEKMNMETLTVNAKYSLGEILTKAGLNTVLGMGTVFVVLIFISFIISLFKYIPAIQGRFSRKKEQAPAQTAAAPAPAEEQIPETDDGELIAVIAAAVAAAEGTTTDGFVVRSIKRRTSNKWN